MTTPVVVVQGTPVSNPYGGGQANYGAGYEPEPTEQLTYSSNNNTNSSNNAGGTIVSNNTNRPTHRPPSGDAAGGLGGFTFMGTKINDPIFAVLFYVNVIAIVAVAAGYGGNAFNTPTGSGSDAAADADNSEATGDGDENESYNGLIYLTIVTGFLSLIASGMGLGILMKFPETIIKISLIFVIIMAFLIALSGLLSGNLFGAIIGFIFFSILICYARAAWARIPFAAVNMITANTAIQANLGIVLFNYIFAILGAGWVIIWMVAFAGVYATTYQCDENGENCQGINYGILFILFLSFFFGTQVLQNSIHVTVAGVVGTWWVTPSENGFCGKAVINSFIRTTTTSFGSVCFGSLLVAILRALEAVANAARQEDGGIGMCIAECILSCLASLLEYFNKWAFIYVGIYGQSYIESGKSVFQLFHNRGWEAIVADDLVGNALLLTSMVVGAFMGLVSYGLSVSTNWLDSIGGGGVLAFFLGFLIGVVICSILLSTVGSGVNAVIVLFAELPAEFEQNHRDLSRRMRETWATIYPGSVEL